MELSIDPGTAERIAWGAWGVLSFITLIAWCRWRGTPQDQEKDEPAQGAEKKRTTKSSWLRSIRRLATLRSKARLGFEGFSK
jgi:hypothetical protein